MLQSEFRQKIINLIILQTLAICFTNKSSKGYLFYNFVKNYESENFDDIELGLKLEHVSDDTYLKAYKIEVIQLLIVTQIL